MERPLALFLLILTSGMHCKVCSHQEILDHLNLTSDNDAFKLTRPVLDHRHTTVVKLNILLYAILAVVEKTQTFIPYVWAISRWRDERISWDPDQFCGITRFSIPRHILWKPDLYIFEMVAKDESPENPNLIISHNGLVQMEEDLKVVSTCHMDVHKFPFDTQECNMSIGSAMHCIDEINVLPISNSSRATQFSREMLLSQGEWEFLHLMVNNHNFTFDGRKWGMITYTFSIKRRPLLHVINFLLPVLFFLILDLASFFIADYRGEKLGFKVTVLLAISVLLLILNEILPSMSNKTPLIATYCIVIFALMLVSLLETILVTYLLDKDSQEKFKSTWEKKNEHGITKSCEGGDGKEICCSSICRASDLKMQHELLPVAEETTNGVQSLECNMLLSVLEDLRKLQKTLFLHHHHSEKQGKSWKWARRINKAFFIFYLVTVSLFLFSIFTEWFS